ncbi:single-stranded-DNA-specific exonuclease RecJ [candidate division WOR-3 bacterium]|uniref:Single-stranded-DNA-specific exonuclease RecJ n=1 Tax=candidate division WOR-3 bacterium TaxID=2052148 RepID=A0A937XJ07_UNCW3|nr:single-stranded-DNA-specific exonuclease RecJ [candidate division WOR-3 bacterium]
MPAVRPTHHWRLPTQTESDLLSLGRELELPELVVNLLRRRGYSTADDIRAFLDPSPARLRKPELLPDIVPATERIIAAIKRRERILIYGDYDVDGVTGTVLLVSVLGRLGADVIYYLPHREAEGYGFSAQGLGFAAERGAKLIVTNDCGSNDHATLAAARDAGIDVIVTDHHEVAAGRSQKAERRIQKSEVPETESAICDLHSAKPMALVNPKRADSKYPFRELAGVGVAFKLAWSVLSALGRPKQELIALLDLVGLGTIADIVPLTDENRVLARIGLNAIRQSPRPGFQALLKVAGIADKPLTGYSVGFMLAPRLNAAGRVGHAELAARLLLTGDKAEAATLAAELDSLNRSRQSLEERILAQATTLVETGRLADRKTIVVAAEGWHEGVIGIVAAKLVDRFSRPCIVVALKGEKGKGSGRSVTGFNLHAALAACSGHLLAFGGHKYAAGLSVTREDLAGFSSALAAYADGFPEEVFEPTLHIDAVAPIEKIDDAFVTALEKFEPFGPDNASPLLASLGIEVVGYPRKVGKNHLKLSVRSGERTLEAIAWGRSAEITNLEAGTGSRLDICYTVGRNTYGGRTATQLTLRDFRTAEGNDEFRSSNSDSNP